jgi:hypothetical protein
VEVLVPQAGCAPQDEATLLDQDLIDLFDRDQKQLASERPCSYLEHIGPVDA